jgi:inosine/xanthosine triphosphatase
MLDIFAREPAALVAVGSTNPVKIAAVRAVLARVAPGARVEGRAVASGVAEQPVGDEETIRGARARAVAARQALDATLGVGLEGGVVELPDGAMRTCAWAVVVGDDERAGVGGSLAMPLPPVVARRIRAGEELGHAMDAITGTHDTKRGQGAVGILTAGLIDRQRAYEALVTYALAPFLAPGFWSERAP